jgi:hypothetical protein
MILLATTSEGNSTDVSGKSGDAEEKRENATEGDQQQKSEF